MPNVIAQCTEANIETIAMLFAQFCPALEMLDVVIVLNPHDEARPMDRAQLDNFLKSWEIFCRTVHVRQFRVDTTRVWPVEVPAPLSVDVDNVSQLGVIVVNEVKKCVTGLGKHVVEESRPEWEF
ncbi:hypothetical protein M427DRAFT_55302 [Gonapodya prolifera JEL478]|uniref:Uncharacterized protein n=1 Tax=Gonapodya prolifera (strain JEL478) TaxID=1344416 RepID=A0A139AIV2_GONPJ|nr:hypothetical protein M427DRAFT_55302 [Gonapodya prolifera JEL478]|eukprot:KXS16649.1 hypothetical protein M427DRAFT_55302 [Gonapodya prolifera JEL478]